MIKYLDLKKLNERFDLKASVNEVIESGNYILGQKVQEFEEQWAKYCGAEYCVSCGNGLNALELAIKSLELPSESEILVPANTFIASILAISNCGFKPVLVEPTILDYTMDPKKAELKITGKTKAILVTHLYGYTADMTNIMYLAHKYKLKVIEDCAQAHGARLPNGQSVGTFGDVGIFSFYPSKNLGALGDAGCVITNNKELKDKIESLRNYGKISKNEFAYKGTNSRMDEIQASILLTKLPYLDLENERRREIAKMYVNRLKNRDSIPFYYRNCVWHVFPIHTERRDELKKYLLEKGIETAIHYQIPPYLQQAYKELQDQEYSYMITTWIHNTELSLPCNSTLTNDDVEYIIKTINEF